MRRSLPEIHPRSGPVGARSLACLLLLVGAVAATTAACGDSATLTTGTDNTGAAGNDTSPTGTSNGGGGGDAGGGGSTGGGPGVGAGPAGENQAPHIHSNAATKAEEGETYYYPALAEDPDGDLLVWSLPAAPPGMTIKADTGLVTWTPGPDTEGAVEVTVRVEDPAGAFDEQAYTLQIAAGQKPPEITTLPPLQAAAGGSYVYQAAAIDPDDTKLTWSVTGPAGMSVDADGKVTWTVPAGASGTFPVQLQVEDPGGLSAVQPFTIGVAANNGPPTAAITAPLSGATITKPITVTGTASDVDFAGYEVKICPHGWGGGDAACRKLKDGLVGVQNGPLAALNPRILPDGGHTIVLTVKDANGQSSTASVDVRISAEKLGALRMEFEDLFIPLATAEISLSRVYDGLDLGPGEVGYGWNLFWSTKGHVEQPAEPHIGWELEYISFPPEFVLSPTNGHPITFELSDGRSYAFELFVEVDGGLSSIHLARPTFIEYDGTGAQIEALRSNLQPYSTTDYELWYNADFVSEDEFGLAEWRPAFYRLTTDANEKITFDVKSSRAVIYDDGSGLVVDLLNDKITYKGQNVVQIDRDAGGLVTGVKDILSGAEVKYARNAAGDLVSVDGEGDADQTFTYGAGHRIKDWTSTGVAPTIIEYDAQGRVIKRTEPSGAVTKTTYDDANNKVLLTNAAGHTVTSTYDDAGRVTEIVDPLGGKSTFTYVPGKALLASQTDPLGRKTEMQYDAAGNRTLYRNAAGEETKSVYDAQGALTQLTDPMGNVFTQNVDALGRPTTTFFPGSATPARSRSYPNASTVVETDAAGHTTTSVVDARGRITSETDWDGKTTSVAYDDVARVATVVEPDGEVHAVSYDRLLRTTKLTRPGEAEMAYEYKGNGGLPTKVTRPDGGVIELVRDASGKVASIRVDGETTAQSQKDALGQVASIKNGDGAETLKYDPLGRVSQVTRATGTFSYAYDAAGQLTGVSTDDGRLVTLERDLAGRVTTIQDGTGLTFGFGYDKNGHITSFTAGQSQSLLFNRDALGRVTQITYPNGLSVGRTYVPASDREEEDPLLASYTGVDGVTWSYTYDGDGGLTQVTGGGTTTTFDYDEQGNLAAVTDALGRQTVRTWGEADTLVSFESPSGKTQSWTYTEDLEPLTWTRADGTTVEYEVTPSSLVTKLPGGEVHEILQGDGSVLAKGGSGGDIETWGVSDVVFLQSGDGGSVEITYTTDQRPAIVKAATPSGKVFETHYTYDGGGRLTEVKDPEGGITLLAYDPNGRLATVTRPNGITTEYTYGVFNGPTKIRHLLGAEVVEEYSYTYDQNGRVSGATTPDGQYTYVYDALSRLVEEQKVGGGGAGFGYDAAGNLVSRTGPAAATFSIDEDDQIVSASGPNGTTTYTYSARGALTQIQGPNGATTFTYDALDRLTGVTTPDGATVTYKYDATGRLLSRTDKDGERRCLPLPETALRLTDCAVTYAPSGNEAARAFVFTPHGILSRHGDAGARYVLPDGKGSVVATTDGAGTVAGRYRYDAWGAKTVVAGEAFEYGYTGERHDAASGLVFLRARHYAPALSRFLTPDPAEGTTTDPRTLHRYAYASNDPLNRVDPSGNFSLVGMLASMNISTVMRGIETFAKECLKNEAKGQIIKSIVESLLAEPVKETVEPILDHLFGKLAKGLAAKALDNVSEFAIHKGFQEYACSHSMKNSLIDMLLGGDGKWSFVRKVGTCGEDESDRFDCKSFPSTDIAGVQGIDVVYGNMLGMEIKTRTGRWHKRKGKGGNDEEQLARFCRWAARKGTHLMIYVWFKMPGYAWHAPRAWSCWRCWSVPPKENGCSDSTGLGSMYIAFGVNPERKCAKRVFVPTFTKSCTDFVKKATCAEQD